MPPRAVIPLSDLGAEIVTLALGEGRKLTGLAFLCPLCWEHSHIVWFQPGGEGYQKSGRLVWSNPSGSTPTDITLTPSYKASTPMPPVGCHLHVFITDGSLEVLGDSSEARPRPPAKE